METTNCKELVGHTPGPWVVQDNRRNGGQIRVDSETDGAVAILGTAQCHRAEVDADARLIAAAPELLGALRAFVGLHATDIEWHVTKANRSGSKLTEAIQARVDALGAAIAKAEGHS